MTWSTVEDALEAFRRNEFVMVMDADDREERCVSIVPAKNVTAAQLAFAIRNTAGIPCIVGDKAHVGLHPATTYNTDVNQMSIYVSADFIPGATIGVSATGRACTARAFCDLSHPPGVFFKPGLKCPRDRERTMHKSSEAKPEAALADGPMKVSSLLVDRPPHGDDQEQFLDEDAFPHFAEFLHETQQYASFSGGRFRAGSFCGTPAAEALGVSQEPTLTSGESELRCSDPRWESKFRAAPVVAKFAQRMHVGDPALEEELERASRIVMTETARNAIIAACRRLDMWPSTPPPFADDADCSYEDMSASLDVIAQRLINDEARRLHCEAKGAVGGLARRAMTASYIVDFAHEIGTTLPPMPETYEVMLQELDLRAQEWEERHELRSTPSSCSRDSLRRDLIIEPRSLLDLDVLHEFAKKPIVVEIQVANQSFRTSVIAPEVGNESSIMYEAESMSFRYRGAPTEISIRVWRRLGLQAFWKGDYLVGEAVVPLGDEIEDYHPRNFQMPLSKGHMHAGVIWIDFCLVAKDSEESPTRLPSFASVAAGAVSGSVATVGSVVGVMEGRSRDARLRPRKGYGTCEREKASWIIVTEAGTGLCYYYAYETKEIAESYFDGMLWRIISRILFSCQNGFIEDEVRQGGPAAAYNTIRKAARTLAVVAS